MIYETSDPGTFIEQNEKLWGVCVPKQHPITKEPAVQCTLCFENDIQRHQRIIPPSKPSNEIYEWQGDEYILIGYCTDEEYRRRLDYYKEVLEEWERTSGIFYTRGQRWYEYTITTKSGAYASWRSSDGKNWNCVETSVAG